MSKSHTEEFLEQFKRTESAIRDIYGSDSSFREFEQKLQMSDNAEDNRLGGRMQLCRSIRNYASHNADIDDFMPIPSEATIFLKKLEKRILRDRQTVKNCMTRIKPLEENDDLARASQRVMKVGMMPVVNSNGILMGMFNTISLMRAIADGGAAKTKIASDKVRLEKVRADGCCKPDDSANDAYVHMNSNNLNALFVTVDGSPDGKYMGMIYAENE